jgi:hypothetical protein
MSCTKFALGGYTDIIRVYEFVPTLCAAHEPEGSNFADYNRPRGSYSRAAGVHVCNDDDRHDAVKDRR